MKTWQQTLQVCDTSILDLHVKLEPISLDSDNVYISSSNNKTFEDVIDEGSRLARHQEERLRMNIRESMEKNADFWAELAKY
jgi:hypothetical protein